MCRNAFPEPKGGAMRSVLLICSVIALAIPAHSSCAHLLGMGVGNRYDYPDLGQTYYDRSAGSLELSRSCGTAVYGVWTSFAIDRNQMYGQSFGDEIDFYFGHETSFPSWMGEIEGEAGFQYWLTNQFAWIEDDAIALRMRFGRPINLERPDGVVSFVPYVMYLQVMGFNGVYATYGRPGVELRLAFGSLTATTDIGFGVYEAYEHFWRTVAPVISQELAWNDQWGLGVTWLLRDKAGVQAHVLRSF